MPMRSPERHCSIQARRRGSASSRRGDLIRGVRFCFVLFILDSGHEFRHIVIALRESARRCPFGAFPKSGIGGEVDPRRCIAPGQSIAGFFIYGVWALIEPTIPNVANRISRGLFYKLLKAGAGPRIMKCWRPHADIRGGRARLASRA